MTKARLVAVDDHGHHYECLQFVCPGCEAAGATGVHMLPVNAAGGIGYPSWTWDGDIDAPTLSPSILTHGGPLQDLRCHSFLRGGIFEFLADSTHQLAGQRVPIPDLPDWLKGES